MTFDEKRAKIGQWLQGEDGSRLWDVMCAQRGPDSPSELNNMTRSMYDVVYAARRKRKFETVEVIRAASWFGPTGGSARSHKGDTVYLPADTSSWDHFDRHVQRAASILGLKVEKK